MFIYMLLFSMVLLDYSNILLFQYLISLIVLLYVLLYII